MNLSGNLSNYVNESSQFSEESDSNLIHYIASQKEDALEELYHRYSNPIFNYIVRLVHERNIAEDILQEVFLGVWNGAGRFEGRAMVKTWLFRIAHFQTAYWLRSQKNVLLNRSEELSELIYDDKEKSPETQAFDAWQFTHIHTALNELSESHREVIELSFANGFSNAEIANIMNCPIGTVKSRLHNALRQLNGILLARGLELDS
jgi:RNA polymerase sigma-70 factor (ECF subfamily)